MATAQLVAKVEAPIGVNSFVRPLLEPLGANMYLCKLFLTALYAQQGQIKIQFIEGFSEVAECVVDFTAENETVKPAVPEVPKPLPAPQ